METSRSGTRIVADQTPVRRSPSGLPTRHLVDASIGSNDLFVAQQTLQPGDRVLRHVHPRDEVLIFLSGTGDATMADTGVAVHAGVTLFVPAGVSHEFRNSGATPLEVVVVFPGGAFAETTLLEARPGVAGHGDLA